MNKELKINISVDKKTGAIKNVDKEFKELGQTVKKNNDLVGTYGKSLLGLAAGVGAVYAIKEAFTLAASSGLEYNKTLERLTNGLTTLSVATSSNISSTGRVLEIQEKYNLAQKEAVETVIKLKEINRTTPHTLAQTVEIYKAMYASMKNANVSQKEMIDLTQKISIVAGGAGVEFNQLLAGVDGLASGTVLANSELGRLLGSLGLNNEELKKSTNIYETINEKLKDIQGIESYDTALSNLTNSFDVLTGTTVEPFFDDIKEQMKDTSTYFTELTEDVRLFYSGFKEVNELTALDELNKRMIALYDSKQAKEKDLKNTSFLESIFGKGADGKIKSEIRKINAEMIAVKEQYDLLETSNESLKGKDNGSDPKKLDAYDKWLNKTNDKLLTMHSLGKSQADVMKVWNNELGKFNKTLTVSEKLSKDQNSHVKEYYKVKDEYEDITNSLVIKDDNFIDKLGEKYESIALKLEATGMSTNSDWEKLSKAYNKEYFDNSKKEQNSTIDEIAKVVSMFSSEIKEVATILVDSLYDGIKNKYESSIDTYSNLANDNSLRATIASSFGQNGQALKYDYQKQLNSISKQEATNNMNYDLSSDAKDYKNTLQTVMEASGIAYSAVSSLGTALGGSGALDGIKFALNANEYADDITSFTKFQTAYINGVETYKEQLISLTETLVGTAATMYDSMKTYQDFYDRLNGNQYENLRKVEAYNVLSSYTDVTQGNISELISDVLKAQSSFITEGIDLAGSNNEDALKSIDLFDKYGLAFDSLDERFLGSIDTITSLMEATNEANTKIKDFAKSLRASLSGTNYENEYKQTTQLDFVKALSDYKKGDIDSSELISIAKIFEGTIADSNNEMRLSLINELEGISEVSTEDYLKNLVSNVDQMMLTGLPVVNIKEAQSVEAQTLAAVSDTNSLLEKMLEILKNPFGSAINIFDEILKVLKEIFIGIFDAAKSIVKGIVDAIKDLVDGISDTASDAWSGITGGISSGWSSVKKTFGFSEGGFTGVGGVNEVAGVVHKGEYVIPHWMLEADTGLYSTLENIRQGNNQKYTPSSPVINATYSNNSNTQGLEDILFRLDDIGASSNETASRLKTFEFERQKLRAVS